MTSVPHVVPHDGNDAIEQLAIIYATNLSAPGGPP
jgi:hypothetical protein